MKEQGRSRRINWVVVLGFFIFSATLYALGMLFTGDSLLSAVLAGLLWAALFVPGFLWVTRQMNKRLLTKGSPVAGPEQSQDWPAEGTARAASDRRSPSPVVGRREGGGFYRQVRTVPWVDPAVAAAHLAHVFLWRKSGLAADDTVTLRHGSRAWLRIMGAWDWGSQSRNRWPFLVHLSSDRERGVLEVTVVDNFGRWLNADSSGSAALTHVATHGDVLLAQILDDLGALGQRE